MDDNVTPSAPKALAALAEVRELEMARHRVKAQLARAVLDARLAGASWKAVGIAAFMATNTAWNKWKSLEHAQGVGTTGHYRPRKKKEPAPEPAPLLHLVKTAVQGVLDGLGETYDEALPLEEGFVHFSLPKRRLTIAVSAHRVNVIRHEPNGSST